LASSFAAVKNTLEDDPAVISGVNSQFANPLFLLRGEFATAGFRNVDPKRRLFLYGSAYFRIARGAVISSKELRAVPHRGRGRRPYTEHGIGLAVSV
jgi:hypothetical protein